MAGTTNGAMRKRRCTARCFRKARIRWASAEAITIFPVLAATLVGQSADLPAALNLEGLGKAAHSHMRTKLEKTIFKVDVLDVDVWFGQEDARHLGRLVNGRSYSDGLADSTSAVAIHSRDALVRILFLRDISLRQFLDGIDENMRHLPEEGILKRADYERISAGLPVWFDFLSQRGIHKSDEVLYRIRGDTLRTMYRSADGRILLDQTDVGAASRLSVLGSYFVRGSDFREGLIKSLFDGR